jgi:hypothetical protein
MANFVIACRYGIYYNNLQDSTFDMGAENDAFYGMRLAFAFMLHDGDGDGVDAF